MVTDWCILDGACSLTTASSIALFSDLTTEELADLLRIAKVVSFVPGKPLCTRGERAASAFVIDHGEVEVWGVSENGKRNVIAREAWLIVMA